MLTPLSACCLLPSWLAPPHRLTAAKLVVEMVRHGKCRNTRFSALYIEYVDRKARHDAPIHSYMSVTIHKSRTISKKHDMVHVRMYAALAARERRRHRSDRPRLDRGPPPGRPGPARSRLGGRHSLPTAPISPPGDRTPTRGAHAAREAASRRRSPPRSALRVLHARLRRCQRRRGRTALLAAEESARHCARCLRGSIFCARGHAAGACRARRAAHHVAKGCCNSTKLQLQFFA